MSSEFPIACDSDITHEFLADVLGTLHFYHQRFGPAFFLKLYEKPNLFLISPDASNFVLQDDKHTFSSRDAALSTGSSLFGEAFLYLDGAPHQISRRHFQSNFQFDPSNNRTILTLTQDTIRGWTTKSSICVFSEAQILFLRINCKLLFGWDPGFDTPFLVKQLQTLASGLFSVENHADKGLLFRRAIASKFKLYEFLKSNLSAFLSLPEYFKRNSGDQIPANVLYDNINMILWAAFDTCSAAFSFLIDQLLREPKLMNVLLQSCATETYDGNLSYKKYIEALIFETLRLWPPVYLLSRTATTELIFHERIIPSGTIVNLAPILLHRLPGLYDNPEEFSPERFLTDNLPSDRTGKYIPFGVGAKACIGKRLAIFQMIEVIDIIFKTVKLELINPIADYAWIPGLRPKKGPTVRIKLT
jgi:cytochrome P450